ncbi:MAG: 4-alpha-glucanotransferase [Acidobacteria bacterium]|nr:4-alpha-glucanotransferase [Acidobacteriota bacterium]MBV9147497.1 4-alpha-glucanotransferase [Acidobacteriota bacterium]
MPFDRACGTLLHITSLPSRDGIGDLGEEAYRFVDFLADSRQRLWQVLPISPAGTGNSPYSATSAFAGNPLLISLERLAQKGWIANTGSARPPKSSCHVDFEQVGAHKLPLLRQAAEQFLDRANGDSKRRFEEFCWLNGWWLEDYVLFEVIRNQHGQKSWMDWPDDLHRREPSAIEKIQREQARELMVTRAIQFFFFEQWRALHQYSAAKGVKLIGDVAIFVNLDSADVWSHPENFQLDDDRRPICVSGVPPDFFSKTGQRWGNPLYRWDALRQRGFDWWIQRMRWALQTCDIIRLDHFRGFEAYWEIPAHEETAVNGRWVKGPNHDLFHALRHALGPLPLIAEDLGTITPEVEQLRRTFEMPGMRILQFGFGNPGAHIYLPHKYERNTVVYTGTHDNDTTAGWWKSGATKDEKAAVEAYLDIDSSDVHWAFVRAAATSVADLCIIPMQDWLGLDSDCRMNIPSRPEENWTWRLEKNAITPKLTARIRNLVEVTDRDPMPNATQQGRHAPQEEFAA